MVKTEKSERLAEAAVKAVNAVGLKLPGPGSSVLIVVDSPSKGKPGTNLEIVQSLISIAFVNGAAKVSIGAASTDKSYTAGLVKLTEGSRARLIDLAKEETRHLSLQAWPKGVDLPAALLDAEVVILAPAGRPDTHYDIHGALTQMASLLKAHGIFGHTPTAEQAVILNRVIRVGLCVIDVAKVKIEKVEFVPNTVIAASNQTEADTELLKQLVSFGAKIPINKPLPILELAAALGV